MTIKQGEPKLFKQNNKKRIEQKKNLANQQYFSVARRLSINPKNDSIELEENYEQITLKKSNESQKKTQKTCPVCKRRPVKTYHHGPGVCHADRTFFLKYFQKRSFLKCTKNRECFKSRAYMDCQSCRLEKCIGIGMTWKGLQTKKKTRNDALNMTGFEVVPMVPKCICCNKTNTVGRHYGLNMCASCSTWFCKTRRNPAKLESLKCIEKNETKKNRCSESFDFEAKKCAKCRFEKINKLAIY